MTVIKTMSNYKPSCKTSCWQFSAECHSHDSWPCFTLSESLQKSEEVFASDTSVEFSAGEYSISTDTPGPEHGITISRAINLILTGPNSPSDQVHINCHRRFRFEFEECENLTIANMVFSSCGSASSTSSGALIIANITSLTVANVTVQHSHGYGLLGMVLSGNVTIFRCKFFNNFRRQHREIPDNAPVRMGGNCLLQMQSVYYIEVTVLTVSESDFSGGIAEEIPNHKRQGFLTGVPSPLGGGGLGVYLEELLPMSDSPWLYSRIYMNITIVNCKYFNNSAEYGGNLLLYTFHLLYAYKSTSYRLIKVLNISISIVNSTFQNGTASTAGGGLHISSYYDHHQ